VQIDLYKKGMGIYYLFGCWFNKKLADGSLKTIFFYKNNIDQSWLSDSHALPPLSPFIDFSLPLTPSSLWTAWQNVLTHYRTHSTAPLFNCSDLEILFLSPLSLNDKQFKCQYFIQSQVLKLTVGHIGIKRESTATNDLPLYQYLKAYFSPLLRKFVGEKRVKFCGANLCSCSPGSVLLSQD
jgi:hypothetical protein